MTGPTDLYKYKALLVPWGLRSLETWAATGSAFHDGDTFNALVSRGEHDYLLTHVRCALYDAPEITGATKPAGLAALAYVRTLAPEGSVVYLNSISFVHSDEEDDFGRMLAAVTLADGRDLATLMIDGGYAVAD